MFGLRLIEARRGFFDRARVLAATTVAERRVLARFGAFVRQRARTSIRPRPGTSAPGQPPFSHTGLLRQFLLFAYDQGRRSVVIGPVALNQRHRDAPRLLEAGGTALRQRRGRVVAVRYAARPFMQPAFAAELPALPARWRDAVR